ncbi:MAG: glycosyltransferase family 2 protein [Candidatus Pacebacteria bacterium]|nr:glycosyltransferase family 2 protein [Candidatus Paceibacterota bacterium]
MEQKNPTFYRAMEIIPAVLAWTTIIAMVVLSAFIPAYVAVFIILFDIYWLLKTIYLSLHLRNSFTIMKRNTDKDWRVFLETDIRTKALWERVHHVVILPMYNEQYEVVRETFERLSRANYPLDKLFVVLALEERAGAHAQDIGEKIKKEFGDMFGAFLVTTHPAHIPGERPGKGSNESYAAEIVKRDVIDARGIEYATLLVSVFDVDTQVYKDYFGILTHTFLTTEDNQHASYQPIPLFLNNVYDSPALARIVGFSGTFWHLMQQSRPEKLTTFSSHSMPFQALLDIGYWQRDIVSEDSRVFWQCLIHYNGAYRVVPLFYPVSMDANVAPTFWGTMVNLYKQQRRWAWGSENIAYMMTGFKNNKTIPFKTKFFWAFHLIEGCHSWATNSLIIFALGWLPILLGGQLFRVTMLAYNLPQITRIIMNLASLGIISSAALSMTILPPKPEWFRKKHYVWYFISWVLMPITLIVFGSFAALDAQTRLALSGKFRLDFWVTPKHRRDGGKR